LPNVCPTANDEQTGDDGPGLLVVGATAAAGPDWAAPCGGLVFPSRGMTACAVLVVADPFLAVFVFDLGWVVGMAGEA